MCGLLKGIVDGQQYFTGRRVGLQFRTILVSEIYSKSLRRAAGIAVPSSGSKSSNDDSKGAADDSKDKEDASVVCLSYLKLLCYLNWIL